MPACYDLLVVSPRICVQALVCLCGLLTVFYPTLLSGFRSMQTDVGDTLLNHYFLEHFFQWVTNREYIGELWSPAFLYPYPEVLAFSDNLFAAGPFYWFFRVFAPADIAYQLWMPAMLALDFASFCWLGRRLGASPLLSAAAAFIFAFGMPRIAQLGHQQLLPQFYTPLALGWFWELARKPSAKALSLALLFTYLQLMAGIYLGWFLFLSLAFFLPLLFLFSEGSLSRFTNLLRSSRRVWLAAIVWVALTAVSLAPYMRAQAVTGNRGFDQIEDLLPRPESWFLPPHGSLYGSLLPTDVPLPTFHEHQLFAGFGVWLMMAAGVYISMRGRLKTDANPLVWASLFTFAAGVFISLRWPGGFSLWPLVYDHVPGGGALRAVSRICLIAYMYALIFGLIGLQSLLTQRVASPARRTLLVAGLLLFTMAEQTLGRVSPSFEKQPFLEEVKDIGHLVSQNCDFAFVTHPTMPQLALHLKAIWAGIETNVPMVNGYSGYDPPNYPRPAENIEQVVAWLKRTDPAVKGRLCVVLPYEVHHLEQYRPGLASPQENWWLFSVAVP